jgi:hypothetical protein
MRSTLAPRKKSKHNDVIMINVRDFLLVDLSILKFRSLGSGTTNITPQPRREKRG